jgi:hypothetical protein
MSNDGRERGTIRLTVPELPKREKGEHWAKRWPACDLIEGDRIMVGFNQGNTLTARVKVAWRSTLEGANNGRNVVSFVYADNRDPENDGQEGTEWADEVYPLLAQVIVGYGADEHAFMTFQDWDRAALYVEKHNQRARDEAELEIEGLKSSPDNDSSPEYLAEYRESLISDRTAHLRPVMTVPEWAVQPSVEV